MICNLCGKDLKKVTECAWTSCSKDWNNLTITQEKLISLLDYNPDTGEFKWKVHLKQSNKYEGDIAGTSHGGGYWAIQIEGRRYYAHRLAWLYMYGKFPELELDHINRDKADNRILNLREVSRSENMNNVGLRVNNSSGFSNISYRKDRNKFRVYITKDGKYKALGHFSTIEDAKIALDSWNKQDILEWDESKIDIIGSNGNEGLHYKPCLDDIYQRVEEDYNDN
jgi:hypothetical protein